MTRISPDLAGKIRATFAAMSRGENAAAVLGALYGLRDTLAVESVTLADLGAWIEDWSKYEARLDEYAREARDDVMDEIDAVDTTTVSDAA